MGEILGNVYISWMYCGDGSAASVLNTQQRFVYMQRCRGFIPATPLRSQIIATLQKSHCVPW